MSSCLPCLHQLLRAAAALPSAAVHLDLAAGLAEDSVLATDAIVLADAIETASEALVAVLDRRRETWMPRPAFARARGADEWRSSACPAELGRSAAVA